MHPSISPFNHPPMPKTPNPGPRPLATRRSKLTDLAAIQHWAAHNDLVHGHEIVKLLVRYGADVNQVSDTGLTPLDLARRAERGENVRFLEGVGGMSGLEVRGHSMGLLE